MESETISFRCRGELKEWLESYADRRMLTISMAAQEIIAKEYREEQATSQTPDIAPDDGHSESVQKRSGSEEEERSESVQTEEESGGESELEKSVHDQVLAQHPDKWWETRSGSKNNYGVERPDGSRKYYKQKEAAAERVASEYGAEGIEISTRRINQERSDQARDLN